MRRAFNASFVPPGSLVRFSTGKKIRNDRASDRTP
jgi:hypothetical protein